MYSSRRVVSLGLAALLALAPSLFVPASGFAADPCGKFSGTWCSQTNGHHGKLCVRMKQIDGCTYKAHFAGSFLGAVPFCYSVPLCVTGQDAYGNVYLSGQSHLPIFGDFTCNAVVTDCSFTANYCSEKDQGEFVMERR